MLDGTKRLEIQTTLTRDPSTPGRAIIGVFGVHDAPPRAQLPIKVTITPRGLGRGPSAGLAFTLEVYDALSGHRLAHGRKIAVTGTIDLNGDVGPIGGVRQKVIGAARAHADLVLVPEANAADARAAAGGRIKVVAVSSFRGALAALGARAPPRDALRLGRSDRERRWPSENLFPLVAGISRSDSVVPEVRSG